MPKEETGREGTEETAFDRVRLAAEDLSSQLDGLPPEERSHVVSWLLSTPVVLFVAIISAIVAVTVGICGGAASMGSALISRSDGVDARKRDAFQEVIEAANEFRAGTDVYVRTCGVAPPQAMKSPPAGCDDGAYLQASDNFAASYAVAVAHASKETRKKLKSLADLLPGSTGKFDDGTVHLVDLESYMAARRDVLRAMCNDLDSEDGSCEEIE